ncbi:unnamed protein product [Rotaria socialis]|uniref:Uncharacterized protein n=2 Tax=Rotaria socialis TaxID=392032 RepID=A0A821QFC7_9BILA|nr:unnamed protein product [Rotaria socialis]
MNVNYRNMKNFTTVVWLDQGEVRNKQWYISLCKIDPYLVSYRNAQSCIDYISNSLGNEDHVVLIVSYYKTLLASDKSMQQFVQLTQVHAIYILCDANEINAKIFSKSTRISGIYTDFYSLCNDLNSLTSINRRRRDDYLPTDFIITAKGKLTDCFVTESLPQYQPSVNLSSTGYNQNELEFLYFKVLRDVLLEDVKLSQSELVAFFRKKFADNPTELNHVEEFEEYYEPTNAIVWYTRDIFLYRLLNKALRDQDVQTLYSMRCFIKDLYLRLKECFNAQLSSRLIPLTKKTVYRGQQVSNFEFGHNIQNNIDGFFSINSFMSTTAIRELAVIYAGNNTSSAISKEQSILFEIPIDTSIKKFSYADISNESAFMEGEQEILFTMGTIFRIKSVIREHNEDIWLVRLELSDEEDKHLHKINSIIKEDITKPYKPLVKLTRIMLRMQYLEDAERFSLLALEDKSIGSDLHLLALIYYQLGVICKKSGKINEAAMHFKKALSTRLENGVSHTDPSLSNLYTNLGTVYEDLGEYSNAHTYHNLALKVLVDVETVNQNDLAVKYSNIASICRKKHYYEQSSENYTNCLQIESEILRPNDVKLLITKNNIGIVYILQGSYAKATEHFHEILVVDDTVLTSSGSTSIFLAVIHWNLACAFYHRRQCAQALECLRQCSRIINSKPNIVFQGSKAKDCEYWIQSIESVLSNEPNQLQKRYTPDPWSMCHPYEVSF